MQMEESAPVAQSNDADLLETSFPQERYAWLLRSGVLATLVNFFRLAM
jgi:hypothetical protein